MARSSLITCAAAATIMAVTAASADIALFGPGGPTPAMKEAATAFEGQTGIAVTVTGGPGIANLLPHLGATSVLS